jgi:hypothetical protein
LGVIGHTSIEPTSGVRRYAPFPAWIQYPSFALLYGCGVPGAKLLETVGLWPWILGALARQFMTRPFDEYEPTSHDVFCCTGFKSGSNWLLQIALQATYRGHAEFEHIHDFVAWPEARSGRHTVGLLDEAPWRTAPTGLRLIKTHHPAESIPITSAARYIALVRNPKDACVSGYHFLRAVALGPTMPSVDRWVDWFLSPRFPAGSWAEHLAGYWRLRDEPNMLFLTFESMKKDLSGTVSRIGAFLDLDLSDSEITQITASSEIEAMRQIEHKFDAPLRMPWTRRTGSIVRRGQVGASSELLSPAQQRRIDDHCRLELANLGCDFPYDATFAISG